MHRLRGSRFQSYSERDSMLLCPSRGKRVPYSRSTARNIVGLTEPVRARYRLTFAELCALNKSNNSVRVLLFASFD